LQGRTLSLDLQAHTSVVRLLFDVEVRHPEDNGPSFSTVILEQVCVVYSTVTEELHSWWDTSESPEHFQIFLSYEGVKWIELSRHVTKWKFSAIRAK